MPDLVARAVAGRGHRPDRPGLVVFSVADPRVAVGALLDDDPADRLEELGLAVRPHERRVRRGQGAEHAVEPGERCLRGLPFGDVAGHALDRDEPAARIEDGRAPLLEPDPVAVRVGQAKEDRVRDPRRRPESGVSR